MEQESGEPKLFPASLEQYPIFPLMPPRVPLFDVSLSGPLKETSATIELLLRSSVATVKSLTGPGGTEKRRKNVVGFLSLC